MNWPRLVLLLGGSALAGLGLAWAILPPSPQRTLDPMVRTPAAPRPARLLSRAETQRLGRFSARATPIWLQLGTRFTASGRHDLADLCEQAQGSLREARSGGTGALEDLQAAQRGVAGRLRDAGLAPQEIALLASLDQALSGLAGNAPAPPSARERSAPSDLALGELLESGPTSGVSP